MKKIILSGVILLSGHYSNGQGYGWIQRANFPAGLRGAPSGFSINNKGYVMCGLNSSTVAQTDLWEWDKTTGIWTQKANFAGTGRYTATAFTIGSKGYITTGWTTPPSSQLNDLWEYNKSSNSWTQKTNFGGSGRYTATSFVINGFAYVGLGYAPLRNDFWKFDPTLNAWTQVANFPGGGRQSASGFAISGYGYVACGYPSNNELWQYNPATNSWLQKANFPGAPRYSCANFVVNGKGIVGTGANGGSYYTDFYSYNPVNNQWTALPNLPAAGRVSTACFAINGSGYLCCGDQAGVYKNDFWEYGPVAFGVSLTGLNLSCYGLNNGSASAVVAGGVAPYTYLWSPGGQTTGNILNLTAGTYSVLVTDANGATATGSIAITQPAPLVGTISSASICKGQGTTLHVTASGGTPGYNYSWTPSAGTADSLLVSPASTTSYSVFIADANGCSTIAATTVTVFGLPAASVSAASGGIACFPNTVKLSSNSNPTYSWQWRKNGANIPGAIDSVYHATQSGTYRVLVANANGCTKLSSPVQVTVAQVSVSVSPSGNVTMCAGDSLDLFAIPSSGFNYQWKRNNNNISGATQSVYEAKQGGTYKVKVTEANSGCTALSAGTTITINCKDGSPESTFGIYPNPTRDHFTLHFKPGTDRPFSLSILDVSGRLLQVVDPLPPGESVVFGDDLQPGTYFLKIQNPERESILRLIKTQ